MIFEVSTQLVPEGADPEQAPPFTFLGFVKAYSPEAALAEAKVTFGYIDPHPVVERGLN